MALLSLSIPRRSAARREPSAQAGPLAPAALDLRACSFERRLLPAPCREGGILTCVHADGRRREVEVALTWDVLAQLRAELANAGYPRPDDVIIRCVLRHWGAQELARRIRGGVLLLEEGLLLDSLGGPAGSGARRLLVASGLLPLLAA